MKHSTSYFNNQGSALVISLLLLLVLTILGLTAMQSTTMQERMAGNMRDRGMAFQASEAILREGEGWIENNISALETSPSMTFAQSQNWNGTTNPVPTNNFSTVTGSTLATTAFSLASEPVFHVGPPTRIRVGIEVPPVFRKVYTVTSFAEGGTDQAVVILQSIYEPFTE